MDSEAGEQAQKAVGPARRVSGAGLLLWIDMCRMHLYFRFGYRSY